jgi:hypothetical protein
MNQFFIDLISSSKAERRESIRTRFQQHILPNGKLEGIWMNPGSVFVFKNGIERFRSYEGVNKICCLIFNLVYCNWKILIKCNPPNYRFTIKIISSQDESFKWAGYFSLPLSRFRFKFTFRRLTFLRRINYLERCFLSNLLDTYFP